MNTTLSATSICRPVLRRRLNNRAIVAANTGPLQILAGKRLLVLVDCQNLDLGARDLGYKVSYRALGEKITAVAASASLHAVFSRRHGDERRWRYLAARGWTPHAKTTRLMGKGAGARPDANADHVVAFVAGALAGFVNADLTLLCSGDGQLVLDIAEALGQLPNPKPVVTLSLAGSTSSRIDARRCPLVKWNLELGKDCLRLDRRLFRLRVGNGGWWNGTLRKTIGNSPY
jgi:hypothetical protein